MKQPGAVETEPQQVVKFPKIQVKVQPKQNIGPIYTVRKGKQKQ